MISLVKKAPMIVIVLAVAVQASVAFARGFMYEYYYYSDASFSTVVGERAIRCDGSASVHGTVTPHVRLVSREPCG